MLQQLMRSMAMWVATTLAPAEAARSSRLATASWHELIALAGRRLMRPATKGRRRVVGGLLHFCLAYYPRKQRVERAGAEIVVRIVTLFVIAPPVRGETLLWASPSM